MQWVACNDTLNYHWTQFPSALGSVRLSSSGFVALQVYCLGLLSQLPLTSLPAAAAKLEARVKTVKYPAAKEPDRSWCRRMLDIHSSDDSKRYCMLYNVIKRQCCGAACCGVPRVTKNINLCRLKMHSLIIWPLGGRRTQAHSPDI